MSEKTAVQWAPKVYDATFRDAAITLGMLSESLLPRRRPKNALRYAACGISGDPSPSEADLRLTKRLVEGTGILELPLIDHIIIGSGVF